MYKIKKIVIKNKLKDPKIKVSHAYENLFLYLCVHSLSSTIKWYETLKWYLAVRYFKFDRH